LLVPVVVGRNFGILDVVARATRQQTGDCLGAGPPDIAHWAWERG